MKAKNVAPNKIVIEGTYVEIAEISVAVDHHALNNPDNDLIKELADKLRNPDVTK